MKSETLSLKTITNKLDFLKKQLLFNETSVIDVKIYYCLYIN